MKDLKLQPKVPGVIAIYGAYGHTGRYVVSELNRYGYPIILCGRDVSKLGMMAAHFPGSDFRIATTDNPDSMVNAFGNAEIIINCAGPFEDTAGPIIEYAVKNGKHYLDISAEQSSVLNMFRKYSSQELGSVVIPAAAFYGGLADLLATHLSKNFETADSIHVYTVLNFWYPTHGTRETGRRNTAERLIFSEGQLIPKTDVDSFNKLFPEPIGEVLMVSLPLTEVVTISRHIKVTNVQAFLSKNSLDDLKNTSNPETPVIEDENALAQSFYLQVELRAGHGKRIIAVKGKDIYAFTAPVILEIVRRMNSNYSNLTGIKTLGEAFDATDFLHNLESKGVIQISETVTE